MQFSFGLNFLLMSYDWSPAATLDASNYLDEKRLKEVTGRGVVKSGWWCGGGRG